MWSSCDPGRGCITVAQWHTIASGAVLGSSLRNASMLLIYSQNPSCLSRGSHSSAGESVRLITVRSAVQARVGPLQRVEHGEQLRSWQRLHHCCAVAYNCKRCASPEGSHGPAGQRAQPIITRSPVQVCAMPRCCSFEHRILPAFPEGLIAQLVRAYGQ